MKGYTEKESAVECLINTFFIYVLPFCITIFIVVNKIWPYKTLRHFFNDGHTTRQMDGAQEVIGTVVFIVVASIFWGVKTLVVKNKRD
jgi:uncharacterized membrane protein